MKNIRNILSKKICMKWWQILLAFIVIASGVFALLQTQKQEITPELKKTVHKIQPSSEQQRVDYENSIVRVMPEMPSIEDEANKTPNELVKDFYDWYIGVIDFRIYEISTLHQKKYSVDLDALIQTSPFISSSFEQNIEKRKNKRNEMLTEPDGIRSGLDGILCSSDPEFNAVKEYSEAQINGNSAEVDILRGNRINDNNIEKIQIKLIYEGQWKIDDIVCGIEE
jgi:hypothetical protein